MNNMTVRFAALFSIILGVLPSMAYAQATSDISSSSSSQQSGMQGYEAATSAFAPISDRIVTDPLYLPLKGQIYGATLYTFGMPTGDNHNASGAATSSYAGYNNLFTQNLSYGFTNDLSAHVSFSYGFDQTDTTSDRTGAVTSGNTDGFTNPTFGVTYRALDQANNKPVDIDISANYAPDMITAQTSGGGHDGTIASGRQSANAVFLVGHEMKSLSLYGSATVTYLGPSHYEWLYNDNNYQSDSTFNYIFNAGSQIRITERFSVNTGIGYTIAGNQHPSDPPSGPSWVYKPGNTLAVNTALNYHFIPNRLVGSLTYTYDAMGDTANEFSNTPASDNTQTNRQSNIVGARLAYVFN